MAKWTVALFGHWKPNYYLRDKITGLDVSRSVDEPVGWNTEKLNLVVVDNSKKAQPGDIVSFKAYGRDWVGNAKKEFLIITIDGPEQSQMTALCETYFDLDSYEIYDPLSFDDWYSMMYLKAEATADPQKAIALLEANKIDWYARYIEGAKERCRLPKLRTRSRRFHIPLSDLISLGVDGTKMLNRDLIYEPVLADIVKTQVYDKKNDRYVLIGDGLNEIQPLTDGELKTP